MALRNGVKKVQVGDAVRYEVRRWVIGPDGERRQVRRRFETAAEAGRFLDDLDERIEREAAAQAADDREVVTVAAAVERWLAVQRIAETTRAAYQAALAPVVEALGDRDVCRVTADDIEGLVQALLHGEGPGGRHWKRTSINPMLARVKAVWGDLERRRIIEHNEIRWIKPLRKRDDADAYEGALDLSDRLDDEEVARLLALHSEINLPLVGGPRSSRYQAVVHAPAVHLALIGLRRGELAGLRWSAIDLETGRITVAERTRVRVTGATIERRGGKTASSRRSIMLPRETLRILRGTKARQEVWRRRAGDAWVGERDLHVLTHADGRPVAPRTLDDWWAEALRYAEIPHRRLHAARHTAASRLIAAGATPAAVAGWLGHSDGGTLVLRTYAHVTSAEVDELATLL